MPNDLVVVPPPVGGVYRIARRPGEVFAPPLWRYAGPDGTFSGRFDDPTLALGNDTDQRFRAVYCATFRIGAFGETLSQFRTSIRTMAAIRDLVDDVDAPESALHDVVDPLDPTRRLLRAAEWCGRRQVGHTFIDSSLQFVDINAAGSLSHLREQDHIARLAIKLGLQDIDLSTLTGSHRALSQTCARYIYDQVDEMGEPRYAGIRYLSHYGAGQKWECWAVFADRLVHHDADVNLAIVPEDPGLLEAARIHNITIEVAGGVFLRP